MFESKAAPRGAPTASARLVTTLLASGWGLAAAYVLFHSLLVTHDVQPCFVALVPLVVVWATLERKRWGRLALLGLSATALGLFIAALGNAASQKDYGVKVPRHALQYYFNLALHNKYFDSPTTMLTVLTLAAMTGFWMRRPAVVAEFERGKRSTLAVAQKAIAMSLVGCWGLTVMFSPFNARQEMTGRSRSVSAHERNVRNASAAHSRKANRRAKRAAASDSSL